MTDSLEIQDEDFAALFEASLQTTRLQAGQTVEGTIVAIASDVAFVAVGGKGEATIAVEELRNEDGDLTVKVGDRLQATIVSLTGGVTLSRRLQRGAATRRQLEDAFSAGLPVEGKVDAEVKGGYTVSIAGMRAFCPGSQIDIVRETDSAAHLGRVYTFRIVEYREDGRKFVVSRRALQQEQEQARAEEVRRTLSVGAIVTGRVVSVRDFGAFIDLGGNVQGLLHVSEMGWSRVLDPSNVVTPGETLSVKVLRIESAGGDHKIALGLKQLGDDPWSSVEQRFAVGQVVEGRVTRVAEFGAFVELEPGIEALAHVSTFPPTGRPGGWAKAVTTGTVGAFEILSLDLDKKRIGVALVEPGTSRAEGALSSRSAIAPGARLTGKVDRHEKFGIFVFLAPGASGLLPFAETGIGRDADMLKAFPIGSNVDVMVVEADPAGRRIRLSIKAIQIAAEAAEVRDYAARAGAATQSSGFGSMADKLRGAFQPRVK